ncbi:MAG: spore maturation protein, partial [Firmicutes bacterium]|nr:spore maturation protein [Bacillota bacterium]
MNIGNFILPALLIAIFVAALIKKVPAFDKFTEGAKKSLVVIFNIFPFLVAVFISIELFNKSGATDALVSAISPVFNIIGIPSSLVKLILVKPFSASASMVVLDEIFTTYGPDSFMGVAASI